MLCFYKNVKIDNEQNSRIADQDHVYLTNKFRHIYLPLSVNENFCHATDSPKPKQA